MVVAPRCISRSKILHHYWTFYTDELQESRVFGEGRRETTEVDLPKAARHQAAYLYIDVSWNGQDTPTRGTWRYRDLKFRPILIVLPGRIGAIGWLESPINGQRETPGHCSEGILSLSVAEGVSSPAMHIGQALTTREIGSNRETSKLSETSRRRCSLRAKAETPVFLSEYP